MSSSVRVRKRLAYVPIDRNKVVVVPTDDIPHPDAPPDSPANSRFLHQRAEQLAESSSSPTRSSRFGFASSPTSPGTSHFFASRPAAPKRLRSRTIDTPNSPPLVSPPKRAGTFDFQEGGLPLNAEKSRSPAATSNDGRPGSSTARKRTSWFSDHVMYPASRKAPSTIGGRDSMSLRERKSREDGTAAAVAPRASISSDRVSAVESVPQVEVIIPDELKSGLGQSLAGGRESRRSLAELHHDEIIEHLDVIDQHISTVSHLSNAANSILVPPLSFYSRKPVITLPGRLLGEDPERNGSEDQLDMHVEELLTKRAKLRRSLQGLLAFLKTPIGIVTAIYGVAVVFWGAAIVLFLAKMINLHDDYQQGFWVEISSQVVNGLFTVQGVGFLPWRIMDTYHIIWISYFDRLDQKLRQKAQLPPLADPSDIPDPLIDSEHVQMLSDKQLEKLRHHQVRFMKSQTWYRPHETDTHSAFPISWAIAICVLVDFNSVFQILLCGCMWSLNRFQRPPWTTGSLIPLSFLCGIGAGVMIWRGGERSKKTEEVEARLRAALEEEKGVLKERYGPEVAEEPALLEKPPSPIEEEGGKEGLIPERRSGESKRSPLLKSLKIDDTMTIPEDQEPPTTTKTPQSR